MKEVIYGIYDNFGSFVKFDYDGNTIFDKSPDVKNLSVAPDGSIYGAGGTSETFVKKFDPDGSEIWKTQLYNEGEFGDYQNVEVGPDEDIYATAVIPSVFDPAIFKLDSSGNIISDNVTGATFNIRSIEVAPGRYWNSKYANP